MKPPAQYFRAGAGAVIVNRRGLVLSLERADIPGAWQFPQGGLKTDEEPIDAARREVEEETGIAGDDLELVDSYPEPLAYELPAAARNKKTGRGQAQYWLLFRFNGDDTVIDVKKGAEFQAWAWMPFDRLLSDVVEFRRSVYRKLRDRFGPYFHPRADDTE